MKLSLIVPCYNEEGNIKKFYDEVVNSFSSQKYKYEIIFINDGSTDNTLAEMKKLIKNKINIKIIDLSRNFGKEAGIYAGISNARGEYISIIDVDLQQKPSYVVEMVKYLDEHENVEMVTAYQRRRKEGRVISFFKKAFYKIINNITEIEFRDGASDFRTFRRCVAEAILEIKEYYRFSKGIFSWIGFNNYYMPYKVEKRKTGVTKWSFLSLWKYAIDGILAFTTAPLKLATFLGFMLSICSGIYLILVLSQKIFFGIAIPGYATIVTLILLLGGIQLFCIGLIGEYLSRSYVEIKNRPIFIAKEIISNEKD